METKKHQEAEFNDKTQLKILLENILMHYQKDTVKEVLKQIPSPTFSTDDLHEVNEVKTILNVYIKVFGSELFREVLEEIESQTSKHMPSEQTNEQVISNISNITSIEIVGKHKGNIDLPSHDISPSNSNKKWQIKMNENGSCIIRVKSETNTNTDSLTFGLHAGDIINFTDNHIHITSNPC